MHREQNNKQGGPAKFGSDIKKKTQMQRKYLKVTEAMEYLGMSRVNLYTLVRARKIPFYRPNGGYIYFSVEELDAWINANRVATIAELEEKASLHMARRA